MGNGCGHDGRKDGRGEGPFLKCLHRRSLDPAGGQGNLHDEAGDDRDGDLGPPVGSAGDVMIQSPNTCIELEHLYLGSIAF